jgi:allantoinase
MVPSPEPKIQLTFDF